MMADHNTNKITVRVQVKPTPVAAETNNQQPTASVEARSDARRTQPKEAIPDAIASGPPIPPTAADNNEGMPRAALAELEQIELDDSILDLVPGEVDDFEGVNLDFAAALLEDGGEEIAQHIAETYNPEAENVHPGQDYPELELGVGGLNLGDNDSDSEEPPKEKSTSVMATTPTGTPAREPAPVSEEVKWRKRESPFTTSPGCRLKRKGFR